MNGIPPSESEQPRDSRWSLAHRTVAGLLWMLYGKGAYAILQILVVGILARLVSPTDFGIVSAALIVISLSAIVSSIGLGPALVQRAELEQRHIDTAFTTSVLLGGFLGTVIWLGAPLAAGFFRIDGVTPVLRALAFIFPLQGLATVAGSLLKRELRFRWLANVDVISYGIGYGALGITLGLLGFGVWALVLGQIAHNLIKTGILVAGHPPRIRGWPERRAFGDLMYFAGGFTVAKIANQVAQQGDYLVVGRFLGPAPLGYYGRAYNLMSAPASGFGTILDDVLFPTMARVQGDALRLGAAYRRGVALIGLIVLPASAALVLLAPEFVHVVLGQRWTSVIAPFQILAAGMLFRTSSKMADSLVRATGAVYRRAWRQILYAALVIAGAWVGQRWGIVGVAWGVLLALTVNFLFMAQLSLSESTMPWSDFWRAHVPAILITLASSPLVWIGATALRHWGAPPVVTAGAGLLIMVGCTLLLMFLAPARFLGADGQWMVGTMRSFVQKVKRPASRSQS
jgi:PST family polysaccharide transporter